MAENINITLQDIAVAVSIIDVCVKRGAVEGSELSVVGSIRDKFAAFVEQNKAPEPKEPAKEAE